MLLSIRSDSNVSVIDEQLYALDLGILKNVTKTIASRTVDSMHIEDGFAEFNIKAKDNEVLFTSIPYDVGWNVYLNGEKIEPELLGDCLMTISLKQGNNNIKMKYKTQGVRLGAACSILGFVIWTACVFTKKSFKEIEEYRIRE